MSHAMAGRCGIYCAECKCIEAQSCPGCIAAGGKLFWGQCDVAKCCLDRGLEHCGLCPQLPCDLLNSYAYHETEGDNGERIRNVGAWARQGFEAWERERHGA